MTFTLRGLAALTLLSAAAVGCGEDELSDDYYGAIDLTPFYADGATAANPRAAIPDIQPVVRGWYKGKRAEYYDFGVVNHRKKRNASGATINEPDIAYVNQMYFFYDSNGNPMFSKPLYDDQRTGSFIMRGGENMLSPTPRDPTDAARAAHYRTPYSQRPRVPVVDPLRGSANYQRPIIDRLHNDATYTGLWEIVTVKATGGYKPDSIKSKKTLDAAVEAGDFTLTRTLKVINCPVIEEKTFVPPSPMAVRQAGSGNYMLVQPRIELWYRTKLGFCFLANGFETIGEVAWDDTAKAEKDPRFSENITLFRDDEVASRGVDTFDVVRYQVGDAGNSTWVVEGRVMKIYTPRTIVARGGSTNATSTVRMVGDDILPAMPKHVPWDAPGYSPIVWLHDIDVPQAPAYEAGSFKSLDDVDPAKIAPRDVGTAAWTKNMPAIGFAQTCVNDGECGYLGQSCNRFPDLDVATFDAPPGKNMADLTIEREGGPRCDLPVKKFGDYCAPGIGRCEGWTGDKDGDDTALVALKAGAAGPSFTPLKNKADAMAVLANAMSTPEARATAQANLDKANWYIARGFDKDYTGRGYSCHPPTGGYCYIRCDGAAAQGTVAQVKKMLTVNDPLRAGVTREQPATFTNDARCGGLELLGYRCLSNRPNKQRVCLRECTTRDTQQFNDALCNYPLNESNGGNPKAYTFSANQRATDVLEGQSCVALANATGCQWNPDFEPRDPNLTLNQ